MINRLMALFGGIGLTAAFAIAPGLHAAEPALESGTAAFQHGAIEEAASRWSDAERAYAKQGQIANRISALMHLAHAQSELGQYRRSAASLNTALELARASQDRKQTASIDAALGNVHIAIGPPETAEQYLREAIALAHELPDAALAASALNDLG